WATRAWRPRGGTCSRAAPTWPPPSSGSPATTERDRAQPARAHDAGPSVSELARDAGVDRSVFNRFGAFVRSAELVSSERDQMGHQIPDGLAVSEPVLMRVIN